MAPLTKSLALAGSLLAAFGSAAPLNKRAANNGVHVVYETSTTVVWTTVDVTTTIYANAPAATAAAQTTVISVTQAAPAVQTLEPQPAPEPEQESESTEEAQPTQPAQPTTTQAAEPEPTQPAVTSAPQPTYTPEPQPEPQQPTTTAAPPPPAPTTGSSGSGSGSSGSSSGGGSWSSGDVTFYDTATSAGSPSSCGWTNDGSSENVLALSHEIMKDSDCGRTVTIEYKGKTATGKVVDKCMGCSAGSIDLSRHFFGELAAFSEGRLSGVKWRLE